MKVLNVNASLDPVTGGGTAERTFQLSREMARMGISTVILTTDFGLAGKFDKSNARMEVIALPCLFKRFYLPKFSFKEIRKLIKGSDIIHLMCHWTFINVLVYYIARKLKKPYVVCPAGSLPIYGRSKIIKSFYNFIVGKKIIRDAAACIAIAPNEVAHFKGYGVNSGKIYFIPNGINRDDFKTEAGCAFREKFDIGNSPFILFMGRLNYIKGPDLLLRAFCTAKKDLYDHHIVFAGPDGGMLSELRNIASQCSMQDKVHFVGYLGGDCREAAYRESELLVIPSRQEAMSIVVLESGICGKPVLITDKCGFNDVAAVNGGIVVPASVEGIKTGLIKILEDGERLRSFGQNLKRYVEDNFTWRIAVGRYIQLYKKILDGAD